MPSGIPSPSESSDIPEYSSAPISTVEVPSPSPSMMRSSPSKSVAGMLDAELVPESIHGELGCKWKSVVSNGFSLMLPVPE